MPTSLVSIKDQEIHSRFEELMLVIEIFKEGKEFPLLKPKRIIKILPNGRRFTFYWPSKEVFENAEDVMECKTRFVIKENHARD